MIDDIDLAPLTTAADAVVGQLKSEILQLSPDALLREPLETFDGFKQSLAGADPLAAVQVIITNLRELIAQVLEKLDLEKILESPLAIYDDILGELRKIDPRGLLTPVYDQLDEIALEVDSGLDETVAAFKRLQDALPSGGGGSSVSIEAHI